MLAKPPALSRVTQVISNSDFCLVVSTSLSVAPVCLLSFGDASLSSASTLEHIPSSGRGPPSAPRPAAEPPAAPHSPPPSGSQWPPSHITEPGPASHGPGRRRPTVGARGGSGGVRLEPPGTEEEEEEEGQAGQGPIQAAGITWWSRSGTGGWTSSRSCKCHHVFYSVKWKGSLTDDRANCSGCYSYIVKCEIHLDNVCCIANFILRFLGSTQLTGLPAACKHSCTKVFKRCWFSSVAILEAEL